jgi:ribosome biogenesis GTPase A
MRVLPLASVVFLILLSYTMNLCKGFYSSLISSQKSLFPVRCFAVKNPKLKPDVLPADEQYGSTNSRIITWYPGHIAKAERELAEYLKKVDVVIEVRDARIPFATTHPMVPTWVGKKPLIIAIARLDQISKVALQEWKEYYLNQPPHSEGKKENSKVFFIDGKVGKGIQMLKREILKAGIKENEKRKKRGISPRAVRAAVIGFPNVGKSALINRILNRKLAKSQNRPGITKLIQWIRIGSLSPNDDQSQVIELLDSPGIIPARQFDQEAAIKLAICNDIGEASYDRITIAGEMCNKVNELFENYPKYVNMTGITKRYKIPNFHELPGDAIVHEVAARLYNGNVISAADRLLSDFRKNMLGYGSLEAPPKMKKEIRGGAEAVEHDEELDEHQNARLTPLDVGKGNYDGW